MDDQSAIRIGSQPPPEPGPRWPVAAGVAAILVVGALVGLGAFTGSGPAVSEETVPEVGPGPVEAAMGAVEAFATAWNDGDAAGLERMIAEDWELISIPGFLDPRFVAAEGRPVLAEGIAFLTSTTELSLGTCDAEMSPPDAGTSAVVRCEEAEFRGAYLEALRIGADPNAERRPGITFGIDGEEFVVIDADAGIYAPQAYCVWAWQSRPEVAASLFDLYCYPTTTATAGPIHAEVAEEFIAAGGPLPAPELTEARLAASFVARMLENINDGNPLTPLRWMSPEVDPAAMPGFAGASRAPGIADYLEWSGRLFRVDPGECPVEIDGEYTIVTCPDMTVEGPFVDRPYPQPTRFTLLSSLTRVSFTQSYHRLIAVDSLGGTPVPVDETCLDLRREHPLTAARTFTDDCTPIYTRAAAEALRAVLVES